MATPTRPCPYCGQQVLVTAAHCGYCGRPLPSAQGGAGAPGSAGPAKTIMGYALPPNFGQQPPGGHPGGPGPGQPGQPAPFGQQPPQGYGQPMGMPPQQQ